MLKEIAPRFAVAAFALSLVAGCASGEKNVKQFWPPPPDAPRIQYLKKVTDSTDVVGKKSISLIDLGQEEERTIPILKPYGIAVHKGVIYLCDTIQAQVVILDLPRKKVSVLSGNKGPGQLTKPLTVTVDADGFIFVADSARKCVMKYGPDGAFLAKIGADENMKPVSLASDDLYLYVLDSGQGLVRVYDRKTSAPVRSFGQEGEERGKLFTPLGLGVTKTGDVYVTNLDGRILHFDRDGHPQRAFGKLGTALSEFNRPRAITFDDNGIMYIVDAASQDVRLLTDQFQLLMGFGAPGTPGSLNVPSGIAISKDDLPYYQQFADPDFVLEQVLFAVSQFGTSKISVYGFGKKKGVDYEGMVKVRQDEIKKAEEAILKAKAAQEAKEKEAKAAQEGKDKGAGPGTAIQAPAAPRAAQ
ncbi:NHL repeat-containing protein [Geomonas propionica]|uniref:6-bladed beta-propeller n=1 Tax=Geomonas propionica TaxID=2798582 RepID=A0ABS0YT45_9BACT|nr:hypothetical protein [Geomonas propionica]MBJ6801096.1 hypothetical protein [Geomonas propionica]